MTKEDILFLSRAISEYHIDTSELWVAPLRYEKNKLVNFIKSQDQHIFSIEMYECVGHTKNWYARVNIRSIVPEAPITTMVIGEGLVIERYARHDHKLHTPLDKRGILLPDGRQFSYEELLTSIGLPLGPLVHNQDVWYYFRPSTFVCSEVRVQKIFGTLTKLAIMRNSISSAHAGDFFAHIHEIDEEKELWNTGAKGFVFSNSQLYRERHPENHFVKIPEIHKGTFFEEFMLDSPLR